MFCTECGKKITGSHYEQKDAEEKVMPIFCTRKCAIDYVIRMFWIEKVEA